MLELVEEQKIPIPRSLMRVALSMMRRSVKKRAGFSIDEVAPIDKIHTSFIPVLFGEQHACIHRSCVAADELLLCHCRCWQAACYNSCLLILALALHHGTMPTRTCYAEELCSTCSYQLLYGPYGVQLAHKCVSAWPGHSLGAQGCAASFMCRLQWNAKLLMSQATEQSLALHICFLACCAVESAPQKHTYECV